MLMKNSNVLNVAVFSKKQSLNLRCSDFVAFGWGDVIWTRDLLVPNQARYQAALRLNVITLYQTDLCFASVFLSEF